MFKERLFFSTISFLAPWLLFVELVAFMVSESTVISKQEAKELQWRLLRSVTQPSENRN